MIFTACAFGTESEVQTPSSLPVSSATVQPTVASSTPLPTYTLIAPPTSLTFPPSPLPTATLDPALVVTQPFIYFTFPTTTTKQIWQMATDGSQATVIYELPSQQTVAEAMRDNRFSAEAFQNFQETFKVIQAEIGYGPREALLDVAIESLTLSPSKLFLAWNETYTFCPGNYCIGQERLVILHVPDRRITFTTSTPNVFHHLRWSPDSQYVVFHEGGGHPAPQQWLLTVSSSRQQSLGAGYQASWSPDSQHLR